ncbi:endonuclease/exonuclease/phosphatase family protein [Daejeonella oryzae]|uniref:endonuclease/exonuclease/phosphatase family protein n=1 Tax=Daejeonella oryzae TaxID=1122943 RepID=UPI0004276138|nr:endonuclease/exonuclease/phosphatase family protein [Daejeonella oryzae]
MIRKKKSKFSFFSKSVFVANVMAAIMLLISYCAAFVDPQTFWPLAFFGLAYPAFFFINVLFIIYWLIRSPKFALLSFLCILTGYKFVASHIGFRETTAIAVPKSSQNFLRVMTYNVHNFKKFGDKNDEFTKDQILDLIRKEQPDVLCIQEFFSRKKGDYNFIKLIQEIMDTEHYYFEPSTDNGYETLGMAIFSKLPIKNKGILHFKDVQGNEALFVDVKFNDKPVRIYNVHFQSINFKPEDYKYIKGITKERDVESSRRIGSRLKRAFLKRSDQVKLVKKHTEELNSPFVVVGDFNDTPVSFTVNYMSDGLKNAFREKGSGFGITYNGEFPNFQIDYILVSKEVNVKNYLIIDKKLSDHYPVRSDLEF